MKHGQRIVLRGEAGCTEPGLTPGDVVLVVQQKQHDTFKRIQQANPSDLLLEKTISLKEALCGCSFTVQHLDGRTLHIKTNEGQVIKPNSFMVVQSEGMPVHGRPFVKGNLYVRFEVSCEHAAGEVGGFRCNKGATKVWLLIRGVKICSRASSQKAILCVSHLFRHDAGPQHILKVHSLSSDVPSAPTPPSRACACAVPLPRVLCCHRWSSQTASSQSSPRHSAWCCQAQTQQQPTAQQRWTRMQRSAA